MSKPDKPGELRDVTVNAISLVNKAANGERFKIFKSAEIEEAPEEVKKDERGLFRILKEFFTGTVETVEKGEVADVYHANKSGEKLFEAFEALMKVLGLSRWNDEKLTPETDSAKIILAIEDFRNIAIEILLGKGEVEKSGRKISGARLSKLKSIRAMISEVIDGLEEKDETQEEGEELTKEEIQKTVCDTVKPIIEKAIEEALTPVFERIGKVEKARGTSNRLPEDSSIEKSSNDLWEGVF